MGEDLTNKSAVPFYFLLLKQQFCFVFLGWSRLCQDFFFMFFFVLLFIIIIMITIIVGITSKRKGFLSNLQHYKFVFFRLVLSSFTKFNAHNFMYSRVVVNRLSTAWPAHWMLLASWCQLLRVQWGHFICVRSASQSSDDFFFQFHLIIWFIKFLHDFCFSPKETKNKIHEYILSIHIFF